MLLDDDDDLLMLAMALAADSNCRAAMVPTGGVYAL